MKQKALVELLNERFRKFPNNNMFFHAKNNIVELEGTRETVNKHSIPPELVKAYHWFSDIWVYIKIIIREDMEKGKKGMPFTSICFFQEIDEELEPLFRAEWDSFVPAEGYNHPQPHWHISNMKESLLSFNNLTVEDDSSEAGDYATLLSNHVNDFINIYAMHFAMAGNWFSDSNMITQYQSEDKFIDWILNLLSHIRKEIEYVKNIRN